MFGGPPPAISHYNMRFRFIYRKEFVMAKMKITSFGYTQPAFSDLPIKIRITLEEIATPEPINSRLAFRLGQEKGVKFDGSKLQG